MYHYNHVFIFRKGCEGIFYIYLRRQQAGQRAGLGIWGITAKGV